MSKIEWTDESWNVTTGCTRVSAGCDNCYAARMTKRLSNIDSTRSKYEGLINEGKNHFNGKIKLHPDELDKPFRWRKPRRVFVNSMSDLFHPEVSFNFINKVFVVMKNTPHHTYQILTKRPDRMKEFCNWERQKQKSEIDYIKLPLPNVWFGTSVENQEAANDRIPYLLECPAAVRFLSCEPLLGPVDITRVKLPRVYGSALFSALSGEGRDHLGSPFSSSHDGNKIHWVITGGESGPGTVARPMHPDWVRSLRDQCLNAGVPFFFKQWGSWEVASNQNGYSGSVVPDSKAVWVSKDGQINPETSKNMRDPYAMYPAGKANTGREIDGREWNQFPGIKQ